MFMNPAMMLKRHCVVGQLVAVGLLAAFPVQAQDSFAAPPVSPAPAESPTTQPTTEDEELIQLLTQYFQADSVRDRAGLLKKVLRVEGTTQEKIARAVGAVKLWAPQDAGDDAFAIDTPREYTRRPHTTRVHVRVPEGYDPEKAYPLILAYHAEEGDGTEILRLVAHLLHDDLDQYLIAAPSDYAGVWLGSGEDAAGDPLALLDALKRRYHVDSDRVYVTGYSLGGHAAFVSASLHPDHFAAAMPLAGTLALQLGSEALDLFLPNLQNTPVVVVYGAADHPPADADTNGGTGGIAEWNRYIGARATLLDVPIRTIALPGAGHDGIVPASATVEAFLAHRRPHAPASVQTWFRYPQQGRTAWLRQTRFDGEPWDAQQVIVSPAEGETPAEAVTDLLQQRLAMVRGRIEGQTIRIETRRCDRVELLLSDAMVDLDQDIEIIVDGTLRFSGRAERRVSTMLEMAARDWDFERLWPVRFRISSKGRAIQM